MVKKRTIAKTAAVTFGAAMTTMYSAPDLNAAIVGIGFIPGSFPFQVTNSVSTNVLMTTTGGPIGSFDQWNDSIGKTMFNFGALGLGGSFSLVQTSFSFGSSFTFGGVTAIGLTPSASGTFYVGFKSGAGNAGWFAANLGGLGGPVTYLGGQYGNAGEIVHVGFGAAVPEPSGLAGLALLAMGATGIRRRRKNAA